MGNSISCRIVSHDSRTPIVAQATTAKKNIESHLDTSHIPVKSAGALLHAWGKAQTAALVIRTFMSSNFCLGLLACKDFSALGFSLIRTLLFSWK